jgi:hypothetical protein
MFVSGFSVEEVQWDDDLALWAAEDDRHFPGRNYTFLSLFIPFLIYVQVRALGTREKGDYYKNIKVD